MEGELAQALVALDRSDPTFDLHLHFIYAIVVTVRERETHMAPVTTIAHAANRPVEHVHILPIDRGDWSSDARRAYDRVLGELDAWSRRQDASRSLNSWVAEEAVRQVW